MRIKFSRKKLDGALIEMQDPTYAAKCCRHLHDVKLGGGRLSVRQSKIPQVTIGMGGNDEMGRDFSKGFEHRYRDGNTKFTQIVMARLSEPTAVLCISNVPEGKISELKDYLVESGYTVKKIEEGKTRPPKEGEPSKQKKAFAFVEFDSAEEAISAVGKLHNTMPSNVGEKFRNKGLVFSFTSKRDI
jgi:RNA recognition motif-containing protein